MSWQVPALSGQWEEADCADSPSVLPLPLLATDNWQLISRNYQLISSHDACPRFNKLPAIDRRDQRLGCFCSVCHRLRIVCQADVRARGLDGCAGLMLVRIETVGVDPDVVG